MALGSQETASAVPARPRDRFPSTAWLIASSLALFFPIFWLAQFSLDSVPGLLRIAFTGEEPKWVHVSLAGSYVVSGTANDLAGGLRFGPRGFGTETLLGVAVAVALGAAVLYFSRRRGLLAGGLFVAMLGYRGFEELLRRLWFERPDAVWVVLAAIFAVLWTSGLRRLIVPALRPTAGYGRRFAAAVLLFTLPLGLLLVLLHWAVGLPLLRRFVWIFIPGLIPAALASLWPVSPLAARQRIFPRKAVIGGVVLTALMAATIALAGPPLEKAFVRRRAARARAMVASLPTAPPGAPYPRRYFQRGVNFTAEFGAPYASSDALEALRRLAAYGVNAVALVPYGWMRPGQPGVRVRSGLNVWESDEGIEDVARLAHSLGMKVFLKPQIWVHDGSTTDIDFRDPAERTEWFAQYGHFIDHYARLAARIHADLFSVGVELAKLSRYDAPWRKLIAGVREIYPGPLVYAANFGPDFRDVTFWDALDYIGLDEYYPLPDNLSTGTLVRRVKRVSVAYRRPVLFTEVGFPSLVDAEQRPWDRTERPISLKVQARCYQAIFRAFYEKPWFEGMYWWKVGTSGRGGPDDGSFRPWGKPAMAVVKGWYTAGGR